jgi:hypothetical protein
MRPCYSVDRTRDVRFADLAVLGAEDVLRETTPDAAPWLVGEFTWCDVGYWLEQEAQVIAEIERASESAEDFDRLAGDRPWEANEPWPVGVGVTSIVAALNAAGCPTAWSTRGKPGSAPGVVFFADAARARLVLAVAERCDLGLSVTRDGLFDLSAGSVTELVAAAVELLAWRDEFEALPPPPTFALLGPDGYWADDLDEIRELLGIE